ncbi:DNA-binding protein [Tardibacter chloracetimidivorans]|uniref:DNA-binding protein n=1 Tax=Tardibacter chloracetimidivorans TaxID=1921510 RepID=A0A1L3ZSY5_9SPHN|nr:AlpA family phage regulatory protein [Tardibacter chloracetimidivorans]API58737.1 DNA-binding protein [Tardibacter chloracetimidivorans]
MQNDERILRIGEVLRRTGLSRATIYRKISKGTFPRQLPISENASGWHASEVARWVSNPRDYKAHDVAE